MPNIRIKWTILSSLIAAQSAAALFWLLSIPNEKSSAVFLGFSIQRLLLAAIPAGLLVLSIALVTALNIRMRFSSLLLDFLGRIKQSPGFGAGFFWVSFISAAIALGGEIGLGFTESVMLRLQPVLWLVFLAFFQTGLFIRFGGGVKLEKQALPFILSLVLIIFLAGLGLWAGIQPAIESDTYLGAGAPVLPYQVIAAFCAGITLLIIRSTFPPAHRRLILVDIITSLLLYVLAAAIWSQIAIPENHFARPSNVAEAELFPASDSRIYDVNAQQMLLGYGLAGGKPLPRPLYSFFIGLIHALFGQSFSVIVQVQTFLLALLPVIIYWLARQLFHPTAGLTAASLFIFREANQAQLSSTYTMSSVRMIMSELFTVGFLLLLIIVANHWLARPDSHTRSLWTGVMLGLTALVRTQTLLLLVVLLVFLVLSVWNNRRSVMTASLWLGIGLLLVVIPWMGRNALRSGAFVFEDTAYAARTVSFLEESDDSGGALQGIINSPGKYLQRTAANLTNSSLSSLYQLPWKWGFRKNLEDFTSENLEIPFFPYIQLQSGERAWMAAHLLIIAIGLSAAWRTAKWSGVLPAGIYLGYSFSSAMVGFSGWRFIQPVDWIVLFYWSMGIIACIRTLFQLSLWRSIKTSLPPSKAPNKLKPVLLVAALSVGLILPVGESLFSKTHNDPGRSILLQQLIQGEKIPELEAVISLAADPHTALFSGTALYPLYLQSERDFTELKLQDSPLVQLSPGYHFEVVTNQRRIVFIPLSAPPDFVPHACSVIIVGCENDGYTQAVAVFVQGKDPRWLLARQPIPAACETKTSR